MISYDTNIWEKEIAKNKKGDDKDSVSPYILNVEKKKNSLNYAEE